MARKQFPPKIRLVLNILFAVVVITALVMGWNREVDDPDAWFPSEVKKVEQTQGSASQPQQSMQK